MFADTKLKEYDVNENSVLEILTQVNIFKREAELVRLEFPNCLIFRVATFWKSPGFFCCPGKP